MGEANPTGKGGADMGDVTCNVIIGVLLSALFASPFVAYMIRRWELLDRGKRKRSNRRPPRK